MPTTNILLFDDEDVKREDDILNDDNSDVGIEDYSSAAAGEPGSPHKPLSSPAGSSTNCINGLSTTMHRGSLLNSSMRRMTNESRQEYFAEDIRASNRLHGYAFAGITCMVLLVSAELWFVKKKQGDSENFEISGDKYCFPWKEIGAICFGSLGMTLSFLILVCHFDTVFAPKLWATVFIDGSQYERTLLRILLVIWSGGVYICTSSFSVGRNRMGLQLLLSRDRDFFITIIRFTFSIIYRQRSAKCFFQFLVIIHIITLQL